MHEAHYNYGHRFYSPSLGRWVSRDPIMEHPFFLMATESTKEKDRDELWLAMPGHEFGYTQNDPLNRIDPLGLTDRWWPFNGRIKVDGKCKDKNIQGVDIDNRKVYNPQPGEGTPWNDDVDFVQCDGKWYKIGARNYEVKPDDKGCCKRPDGFQEATPDERKAIDDIIRNPGKKDKK